MRYVMKNFEKIVKVSNVGQPKPKRDTWKRERALARKTKLKLNQIARS
jgi:hypothetical protein